MASVSPSKRHSMSTIESSVTRLLVATKHLLESLTQWAKRAATEGDISDAYVQLGNEFKVACRAFSNAGVDVSDLGDVPHALRVVLEEALCETPSQESLDKFLPNIREIIVTLLQNLKNKQAIARTFKANDKSRESLKSTRSEDSMRRASSISSNSARKNSSESTDVSSSNTIEEDTPKVQQANDHSNKTRTQRSNNNQAHTSSQKQVDSKITSDALAQLQKGDSLQRRASRRFSAYQYAKLASYSPGRDPELPDQSILERSKSLRNSPLQNRIAGPKTEKEDQGSLNVFLKLGERVKKCEVSTPLSFTSLRLLFVEKFAYSPGSGTFPDIYIKDSDSDVSYELEEQYFNNVKNGAIISLNISKESELSEAVSKSINDLKDLLKSRQDEFFETTKNYIDVGNTGILEKIQSIAESSDKAVSKPRSKNSSDQVLNTTTSYKSTASLSELLDIRHELSIIKQINNNNKKNFKDSVEHILQKVRDFKSLSLDSSKSSNRVYMEESHGKLSKDSDNLLTKFDDVQDLIEALRKDVAQRGARPSEKQLDFTFKQLQEAQKDLDNMVGFISTEKPNWKKIWESELDTVCSEQQFLTLQEDLAHDLKEDLERATETFELVKKCCEEQSKNPRTRTANLPLAEPGSLPNLRDALMSEVEALKPNHDSRVEAIERAEKLREKERQLAIMNGFEEELGGFVEDNKLKKSGGIEEVERVRREKDEKNLRSAFPPPF